MRFTPTPPWWWVVGGGCGAFGCMTACGFVHLIRQGAVAVAPVCATLLRPHVLPLLHLVVVLLLLPTAAAVLGASAGAGAGALVLVMVLL